MNTYKITNIDAEKGHVSVIFSVDGKEQTMCDAPLGDAVALDAFLTNYGLAYEAGLAQAVVVPAEVTAMIGETKTVDVARVEEVAEEAIINPSREAINSPKID